MKKLIMTKKQKTILLQVTNETINLVETSQEHKLRLQKFKVYVNKNLFDFDNEYEVCMSYKLLFFKILDIMKEETFFDEMLPLSKQFKHLTTYSNDNPSRRFDIQLLTQ